ncbi:TRAF3-interacting JNK-activating modulator isoform X2 [Hemicordylus capensis]|uniref:TRAF3-interacting JNK-activating modulator isoform X2 n=1 Tax=Hemicordylus capensis TaxID=884348 RepID=UPI0023046619|nr:TRAF3-interacting JNK-activating modulator isoform X2 [Hemicordylus capensis]
MISGLCKSYRWRGPRCETYEEKCDRRQEKRENLRRTNNMTMCRFMRRCHRKEAKESLPSPRQIEFLRRRNLITEESLRKVRLPPCTDTSLFLEDQTEALEGRSAWTYLRSSPTNQMSSNNSTLQLHPKSIQHGSFSDAFACGKLKSLPENKFTVKVSKHCKGTQTTTESVAEKKNSGQQTDYGIAVLDKEIIQLSNYLNEALHRELVLKQKMVILQELLATLLQAAEKSWKGQLNEDKLKCRLSILENQLQICAQSCSKRGLKRILLEMEDQKQNYEQKAKDSLQKLLEEKLQAERQLQNAERVLAVAEEDCAIWKEHYNTLKKDWSQLTDKHIELENKLHDLENKLQWSEAQNSQLHQTLQNLESERASLYSRIDILQEDERVTMEFLSAMEGKLQTEERQKLMLEATIKHLHNVIQNQSAELKASQDERQKTGQLN